MSKTATTRSSAAKTLYVDEPTTDREYETPGPLLDDHRTYRFEEALFHRDVEVAASEKSKP